jgi:ubiquinone/menaquinone biosynthesis C-methylase UbiE
VDASRPGPDHAKRIAAFGQRRLRIVKSLIEKLLRRRAQRLVRFILPELPAVGRILDVGSGTGHNADYLAGISTLEVIEADVVDFHAVGRGPDLFDGKVLPFADAEFSATIVLFVLQYTSDPESLLREMRRVTSGRVIVLQSTYSGSIGRSILGARDFVTGRFAFFVARRLGFVSARTCSLRPERFFTRQRLEEVLGAAGFRVRAIRRFDATSHFVSRELYVLEPIAPCP